MTNSQAQRGETFRRLHSRPGIFAIPNPWDAGSARMLETLGFEALATTSAGFAFSLGRPDAEGALSLVDTLDNARAIVAATNLPVSADLENGFGDDPEACAETIRQAAKAGLVGGSIEDATGRSDERIYPFALAVERVKAAVAAARAAPYPFVLTARAENLLHGRLDLDDTIRRLQAFEKVGADVLYAPGLRDLATIRTVVSSVSKPVNVVMSTGDPSITLSQLAEAGVKRVSVGGALSRLALAAFLDGAREMMESGGFTWVRQTVPTSELKTVFTGKGA